MDTKTPEIKERFIFRIEPSLIRRCDVVAEARYGGNRSLVTRKALLEYIEKQERELGIAQQEEAA